MPLYLNDCLGKDKAFVWVISENKRSFEKISVEEEIDDEYGNEF